MKTTNLIPMTDPKNRLVRSCTYLDLKKMNRLAEGNALTRELIHTFLDCTPPLLKKLRGSLEEGEAMKTSKLIHQLKSSVKLFCNDKLFSEIFELETGSLQIDMPEYMVGVMKLILRIESLQQELKILLQSE